MKKDIFLSEDRLRSASESLNSISQDAVKMKQELDILLQQLSEGFDTPAGHKLIDSTEALLLGPLTDMALLLQHIASALNGAKSTYAPVFDEYRRLNSSFIP